MGTRLGTTMTCGRLGHLSRAALTFLAAAVLHTALPAPARANDLERKLFKEAAPKVLAHLQQEGYHNVGVLKFQVKKGNAPASDNVGPINLGIANRLELALVLANKQDDLGILRNASLVAARIPGANHLTPEGRRKLFERDYPLAWGNRRVRPDAFVFGLVQISPNLRDVTVAFMVFGKNHDYEPQDVKGVVRARVDDVNTLIEMGESFRGLFDHATKDTAALSPAPAAREPDPTPPREQPPYEAALAVKNDVKDNYPLAPRNHPPVVLEIRYDNQLVPFELRDGKALVPEPREDQYVTFVLRRTDPGPTRYGVVLKVNGMNTFYKQRLRDVECRKWILDPGDPPIVVKGFQRDDGKAEQFRVLSQPESRASEMNYGADAGIISFTVFQEYRAKDYEEYLAAKQPDVNTQVVARGDYPPEAAETLDSLKSLLRNGKDATRGLIEAGSTIHSKVQVVPFKTDPKPVLSATIRYYHPQGAPLFER